jgi:RNA polymerase sigma factor (sigma-70 family)
MLTISSTTVRGDDQLETATVSTCTDQIDWLQLTTRITAGEEAAFAIFYDHFFDRLFRYVLVMTRGDEQLSRDLLQRTMVKVVRYLKPLPDETIVWSWLTQLAKTSFIDLLRSQRRGPELVALELVKDISQPQDSGDDENLVLESALEAALKLLAVDEKELIQSVYFEELSHKQIAESMRSTPKAVESKLARVRRKLRSLLTGILNNENTP